MPRDSRLRSQSACLLCSDSITNGAGRPGTWNHTVREIILQPDGGVKLERQPVRLRLAGEIR
jgi:hypothetical protein